MLMHHKLILAVAILGLGCFLVVKFSIWFVIIPIIFLALIGTITKSKDVLKIIIPISALLIIASLTFGIFSGPSQKELKVKLASLNADLQQYQNSLSEKNSTLNSAKKKQGWLRKTFNDTQTVDQIEIQVKQLQEAISRTEKEIYETKKKLKE